MGGEGDVGGEGGGYFVAPDEDAVLFGGGDLRFVHGLVPLAVVRGWLVLVVCLAGD